MHYCIDANMGMEVKHFDHMGIHMYRECNSAKDESIKEPAMDHIQCILNLPCLFNSCNLELSFKLDDLVRGLSNPVPDTGNPN